MKGKGNHSNKRLKTTANQIFARLNSLLSLKYRNIQNITQGLSYSSWNGGAKFDYHFLFVNYTLINLDLSIVRHPVHIVDKNKKLSPSAFIPFCEFGGNMTAMGLNTELFDVRVDDFVMNTTVVIC